MGAGRKTQTFVLNERTNSSPLQFNSAANARNLGKSQLGGVIFGCKNTTIKECLLKQLFGLPNHHFSYVKNIEPGLPLFLFNYTGRSLHGIFEAASCGNMNIDPYAWTTDGSERTLYPAQVQVRVRMQCEPLSENVFKPVILDNYYSQTHFWFELDHAQTSKLLSLLSSRQVAPRSLPPQNTEKWRAIIRTVPSSDKSEGSDVSLHLDANDQPVGECLDNQVLEDEKDVIYMKLKELALTREYLDSPFVGSEDDTAVRDDLNLECNEFPENQTLPETKNDDLPGNSSEYDPVIAQLFQEMDELKASRNEQNEKIISLEQKLAECSAELQFLKEQFRTFAPKGGPPHVELDDIELSKEFALDSDDLIYLVGGYDGESWLSKLDYYSPSQDLIKPLQQMSTVRAYAPVVNLNNEHYVFGGGIGSVWYDSVESYDPSKNQWNLLPSLNKKKGSLAGAALNGNIFALGGGNGSDCFSEVEMLDLDAGRWISSRSMLNKRFALTAVELNGAIYAIGGYSGNEYLKSAERFDPREHSWSRIESMNTSRGCHSVSVLNEKIYVMGGYDGNEMVSSVEIYDPRRGSWTIGESTNYPRGYGTAATVKDSIYLIGGLKGGNDIVDVVERYREGQGWEAISSNSIGGRCFLSAIAA